MGATRTLLRNGKRHEIALDAKTSFLEVVRGPLGIHSAARGCGNGRCGACRVLVEGEACNSCMLTLGDVPDGARVEGYEDVSSEPAAERAVRAFVAERATRCSLCVPSIGVTAVALARHGQSGDEVAIDATLESAACMCTGRGSLRRALVAAARPQKA
jgi:aerobic-type carbon monoxide dehydrogenase small subunit (CoxS/CutS family)